MSGHVMNLFLSLQGGFGEYGGGGGGGWQQQEVGICLVDQMALSGRSASPLTT